MGSTDNGRSIGSLVRDLAGGGSRLVRQELRMARLEVAELIRGVGTGSALVALGAVLSVLGVMTMITGLIMLVGGAWLSEQYWLAALGATVLLLIGAAIMARRGAVLLQPARLAPDETVATLKEDKEWLKRQLTSGGTSN
jgi:cytochrome c biogenesis protein CcdA